MNARSEIEAMATTDPATGRDRCGRTTRSGTPCDLPAGFGTDHVGLGGCKFHAGSTRNGRKHATKLEAARAVALWGGRLEVHPAEALLELVQTKAAEVAYWRFRVAELLDADDAGDAMPLWGKTREKIGGDDDGITEEAKPPVEYTLLVAAEKDLAAYASAALRAGVDAAMVQLAQVQASQVVPILNRLLDLVNIPADGRAVLVQQALGVES